MEHLINSLKVDKDKGTIRGRRDPDKEFELLEKLGEGYVFLKT